MCDYMELKKDDTREPRIRPWYDKHLFHGPKNMYSCQELEGALFSPYHGWSKCCYVRVGSTYDEGTLDQRINRDCVGGNLDQYDDKPVCARGDRMQSQYTSCSGQLHSDDTAPADWLSSDGKSGILDSNTGANDPHSEQRGYVYGQCHAQGRKWNGKWAGDASWTNHLDDIDIWRYSCGVRFQRHWTVGFQSGADTSWNGHQDFYVYCGPKMADPKSAPVIANMNVLRGRATDLKKFMKATRDSWVSSNFWWKVGWPANVGVSLFDHAFHTYFPTKYYDEWFLNGPAPGSNSFEDDMNKIMPPDQVSQVVIDNLPSTIPYDDFRTGEVINYRNLYKPYLKAPSPSGRRLGELGAPPPPPLPLYGRRLGERGAPPPPPPPPPLPPSGRRLGESSPSSCEMWTFPTWWTTRRGTPASTRRRCGPTRGHPSP